VLKWLLAVALLVAIPGTARTWSVGRIEGDKAEMGRVTCGLLEKYGPSRSYHFLLIAIADSPYGPLEAAMGPSRRMELSAPRYTKAPTEAVSAEIRGWLVAQLPAKPRPCTFLLAEPAWLDRVGYPEVPAMVPEEEYIPIQLDLAQQAATADPDWVWRWSDGALAALRGLDRAKQRKYQNDPRVRGAAYAVVEQPAPAGLSTDGKRGYCVLYDSVESLFPPRTPRERRSVQQARRTLGCR
jgi:hypothetical protein